MWKLFQTLRDPKHYYENPNMFVDPPTLDLCGKDENIYGVKDS